MQTVRQRVIVGARGSRLSLAQTGMVVAALKKKLPGCSFVVRPIVTLGDRTKDWGRSDTGIFVKELEEALKNKRIDMAVHSVKDMPSVTPPGLSLAAVTRREDPRDMLISAKGYTLGRLPRGSLVGTTSLRRKAQLLRLRPDLKVADLRGNLDTRIGKLLEGRYDAIVVAAAGVRRLGCCLQRRQQKPIPLACMLPAVGQGALGIEVRSDDRVMLRVASLVDHPATRACVAAERAFLRETKAGCRMPVAGHARQEKGKIILSASVISLDGRTVADSIGRGAVGRGEALGARVAAAVLKKGGRKILEGIRDEK